MVANFIINHFKNYWGAFIFELIVHTIANGAHHC